MRIRDIVVGTDGTTPGSAAVRWAAREARRRHGLLRIVHAFSWDWQTARYDSGHENVDVDRQLAGAVTAAAIDEARRTAPSIAVEVDTVIGDPVPRLLAAGADAELVVVGCHGRGGLAGLLLGSVSQRIATQASGPVAVVRGRTDADEGPVAVGLDDSPAAGHVLQTGFENAAGRACAVSVFRAHAPDAAAGARLEELLGPWREKYPDVPVGVTIADASPGAVLATASDTAQLLVIGSHGRGALAGTLLGSTGMYLLRHADCPVLITRERTEGGEP